MAHDVITELRPAWTAPASTRKTVTPLYGAHRAFGARFGEYAGITMPMRYAGEIAEARAVRTAAGLFDLSYLGAVAVTGRDAAAMLDYAFTSRISALDIGRARAALMCAPDGGMLEGLVVARLDAAEYILVSSTTDVEWLISELTERGTKFTARVDDRTEDYAVISVEGPRAAAIVGALTPIDPRALRYFECVETTVAGRDGVLGRSSYSEELVLEFYCAPDDAPAVWYALAEAGIPHGIQPGGLAARNLLRVESAIPLGGCELTADHTPYDARLGILVDLSKDDFIGKSALVPLAQAPAKRSLFGLTAAGRRTPRPGQPVVDAATGAHVGVITSGAWSPILDRPAAMGYLEAAPLAAARELAVRVEDELRPVTLTPPSAHRRRNGH